MSKRINIILPDKTAAVLDRVATKGTRSRFIDRAIRQLVETEGTANLRAPPQGGSDRECRPRPCNCGRVVPARGGSGAAWQNRPITETQAQTQVTFPRRGEIYLVAFDSMIGHDIQRTRPALVIQNDISNEHSPITIVAAISSQI